MLMLCGTQTLRNFDPLASAIEQIYLVEASHTLRETQQKLLCGDAPLEKIEIGFRGRSKYLNLPIVWCEDIRFVPNGKPTILLPKLLPNYLNLNLRPIKNPVHICPRILRRPPNTHFPIYQTSSRDCWYETNSTVARTCCHPYSLHHHHHLIRFLSCLPNPRIPTVYLQKTYPLLPPPPYIIPTLHRPPQYAFRLDRNIPRITHLRRQYCQPHRREQRLSYDIQTCTTDKSKTQTFGRSPNHRLRPCGHNPHVHPPRNKKSQNLLPFLIPRSGRH